MPTVFIRCCTCPIAENDWFISECSCKRTEQLLVPRNTTDMRGKHGRDKTITQKWWEVQQKWYTFTFCWLVCILSKIWSSCLNFFNAQKIFF